MPRVIKSGVREVVLKVREFFMKEKKSEAPIIPFERVNERVAAATGVSLRTVTRFLNEGRLAEASSSKIVTPGKNRKTRKDKILMDNFDIGVLRRKIHEFYTMKKEIPTVKKLHCVLKEEIGFRGSREILRQHIKEIGFRFKKTKNNRKVLIERNDLKEPSLVIMDNAPYHNTSLNKPPNTNSRKGDIIEWLARRNIEYSEEYTKPQLLEIVKRNKPEAVYAVDAVLKGMGHKISRLPPYHCDLNPIEMVWASMKREVADVNIGKPSNEMPAMVENAFNAISAKDKYSHQSTNWENSSIDQIEYCTNWEQSVISPSFSKIYLSNCT